MCEICLFAGTTEGRRLAEFLADEPVRVCACVATEYGEALIPRADNIETLAGRMDEAAMSGLFSARRFDLVIDATHPFATLASRTIAAACRAAGVEYLRLIRDVSGSAEGAADGAVYVDSIQGAADYLAAHPGVALLTTGSKELAPYAAVEGYRDRFYLRVLPLASSLDACAAAGFPPAHIIAMQGPFSVAMNAATLKAIGAKYLVTKESGGSGGFQEKLEAARQAGAQCVVIGQPEQAEGLDYAGVVRRLIARYNLRMTREIDVVGIGMGARDTLTFEADAALRACDCVIGAKRMLEAVSDYGKPCFDEIAPEKIVAQMEAHPEYRRFAVVMSGDTGFFSGAKKLLPLLAGHRLRVIPGLSTLQVLCARFGLSWDDVHAISLHGRPGSAAAAVRHWGRVFALLDGTDAVRRVCADLIAAGMGDTRLYVGQRLSYPDEKLTQGTAEALKDCECAALSAVLIEKQTDVGMFLAGLPDESFIRGDSPRAVPMTKSEVRAVSLSKLRLTRDAVVYDIGAGTGSVSVELALNCPLGQVYAIECRDDAAELIERNRRKFGIGNLTVVRGAAPESMEGLPAPTHAFIGGSGGSMGEIVDRLLALNPRVRIVINAIALESVGEIAAIANCFTEHEIVQLSVARSRRVGAYHLMTGLNPVTIAAMQNREEGNDEG